MRKDSQIFLKKILDYRNSTGKNNFELNYKYFDDIPSVETAIYDILDDLVSNNCLTSKSQVIDLEGNISINLTLDGITYFNDEKEKNSAVIFNVSGGQINIAKENAKIDVNIIVEYGVRIPEIAFEIQTKVKKAVETMTGLKVTEVNVHVQGVNTNIEKKDNTTVSE